MIVEAEDLSWIEGAGGEGDVLGKSVGGSEGGLEVDDAGLGNVGLVTGLKGEGDACLVELGGEGKGHVFEIAIGSGHRGMDDDGNAGSFDFIEEEVGFGRAIEDEVEAEFLAKPEGGGNVLVSLGVDEEGDFLLENLCERFEFEIGVWWSLVVFRIGIFLGGFMRISAGFNEFGAEEGDGFGAGAGGFASGFKGTRA